jgi:hypothetical protein
MIRQVAGIKQICIAAYENMTRHIWYRAHLFLARVRQAGFVFRNTNVRVMYRYVNLHVQNFVFVLLSDVAQMTKRTTLRSGSLKNEQASYKQT